MAVMKDLIEEGVLAEAAECLKVIAHPDRLRIVEILARKALAVHEVAQVCGLAHAAACGHLRLLKGHGLLDSARSGRSVTYSIADKRLPQIVNCIRAGCRKAKR